MTLSDTPLVLLRAPEPADVDTMYLWENGAGAALHGSLPGPVSRHQLWQYVQGYDGNPLAHGQGRFIIMASGERVGMVDLYDVDPRNRNAKVGILIASPFRCRGYGLAALRAVAGYASSCLGLHRLAALVAADNAASRALFAAAGFTEAGRLPGWIRRGNSGYADAVLYCFSCTAD